MAKQNRKMKQINMLLEKCSATEIVNWSLQNATKPVISTSFGPNSAVLLHIVTQQQPNIPVIWVDSGYNTDSTYKFALQLIDRLQLNIKIYTPKSTSAFLNVKLKGIPDVETQAHQQFTQTVKLEPFARALVELKPDIWLTGIRSEETSFRQSLNIASQHSPEIIKIVPLLNWSEEDVNLYIERYDLPVEVNYFDPTKVFEGRECGLHTTL